MLHRLTGQGKLNLCDARGSRREVKGHILRGRILSAADVILLAPAEQYDDFTGITAMSD
jgi:hypothetical protein